MIDSSVFSMYTGFLISDRRFLMNYLLICKSLQVSIIAITNCEL